MDRKVWVLRLAQARILVLSQSPPTLDFLTGSLRIISAEYSILLLSADFLAKNVGAALAAAPDKPLESYPTFAFTAGFVQEGDTLIRYQSGLIVVGEDRASNLVM